jgi:hypothetical protein
MVMEKTSQISGFYKLSPKERLEKVAEFAELTDEDIMALGKTGSLEMEQADRMIENVVGTFELPVGIAVNFQRTISFQWPLRSLRLWLRHPMLLKWPGPRAVLPQAIRDRL